MKAEEIMTTYMLDNGFTRICTWGLGKKTFDLYIMTDMEYTENNVTQIDADSISGRCLCHTTYDRWQDQTI